MVVIVGFGGRVQIVVREPRLVRQRDPFQKPLPDGLIKPARRDDITGERIARKAAWSGGVPAGGQRVEDAAGQLAEISLSHLGSRNRRDDRTPIPLPLALVIEEPEGLVFS